MQSARHRSGGRRQGTSGANPSRLDQRCGPAGRSGRYHRLEVRGGESTMSHPRRGKTLVEALVIMSLLMVALAASTTTLAALFRIERYIRRDTERGVTLERLAAQLRTDS